MPQQYLSTDPYEGIDWSQAVHAEATKQGIDPQLALSVARTESSLNPHAKSPKGALGIMQLMPETAKRHGVDANDPYQNITGGVAELRQLLSTTGGNKSKALALYNGSPQAPATATAPYVQKVLAGVQVPPGQTAAPTTGKKYISTDPNEGAHPGFLGDPTKPATITGPPGLGETLRRSLPEVGGALGMALGSEAGPAGVGVGGYLGGQTGKAVQQLIRAAGYGPPPPSTFAKQQAERNTAGLSQAANAAFGEVAGAAIPGGYLLHPPPGAVQAAKASTDEGLGLSLPEVLKNTKFGTVLSGIQQLTERATGGRMIAESKRARWAPAIRQAYAAGKITLQDIGKAKGTLETGADMIDNRPIKAAAQDLIDREIAPRAVAYGGAPPATAKPLVGGRPFNELRPELQAQLKRLGAVPAAKPMVPKGGSPLVRELYNTANSPDEVPFTAAVSQRAKFWDMSRTPLGEQPTSEQGRALAMHGSFTKTLEDANPVWGDLTHTYHDLRQQITQPFVKKIIKQDPQAWSAAITQAQQSKPYKELTGDQEGVQAIQRLKTIGAAAARRDPTLPSRGWFPVLEAVGGWAHLPSLVGAETASGLFTAAMYSPSISKWLIQGFKAPNAQLATTAFTQAVQAWRAGQTQEEPPMQASHTPVPPSAASTATPPPPR